MGHTDIIYVVTETDKSKYDAEEIVPDPEFKKKTTKKTQKHHSLFIFWTVLNIYHMYGYFLLWYSCRSEKKHAYLKLDEFS